MKFEEVVAQKIDRGDSANYLFAISIEVALSLLEIPDPAFPFPDNRRVNKKHAMDFGNYWEKQVDNWIVPPLLLDCTSELKTSALEIAGNDSELVKLSLPLEPSGTLRILDGQHRILGWYLKRLELGSRIQDETTNYNKAIIAGDSQSARIATDQINYATEQRKRFRGELVAINLVDSLSAERHQQFFVDIAKNALGINKTVQAKFDSASIINRVTRDLIERNELLADKVDLEKTTCSGSNTNLLTVVNVSDVVRHLCFGINSRVTSKKENRYKDEDLYGVCDVFFDSMIDGFPQLKKIKSGHMSPLELRKNYLLGSGTIWRCLAGAFYEACVIRDDELGSIEVDMRRRKRFVDFLSEMSNEMEYPISRKWFGTQLFPNRDSKAPSSRLQDLDTMVELMTAWIDNAEMFQPGNAKGLI
jgi:DGQHR domain-containing protein